MAKGLPKSIAKKYGITKKAWRVYRAGKGKPKSKGKTKQSTSKRRKSTKKVKNTSKGSRILGNMGLKGLIISGAILSGLKFLMRTTFPQAGAYTTSVSAIGAGIAAKALNTTGKSLLAFGAVDGVSELITDLLMGGGMVTLPGIGGQAQGGYDFV